jgi:hypothetical protein
MAMPSNPPRLGIICDQLASTRALQFCRSSRCFSSAGVLLVNQMGFMKYLNANNVALASNYFLLTIRQSVRQVLNT